jgi:hypothetical protein
MVGKSVDVGGPELRREVLSDRGGTVVRETLFGGTVRVSRAGFFACHGAPP